MSKALNHFNGDRLIGGPTHPFHDGAIRALPQLFDQRVVIEDLMPDSMQFELPQHCHILGLI